MLEVDEFASTMAMRESTPKLLIGNKCDLTDRREVDWETASNFAGERAMSYVETSAVRYINLFLFRKYSYLKIRPKYYLTYLSYILCICRATSGIHEAFLALVQTESTSKQS